MFGPYVWLVYNLSQLKDLLEDLLLTLSSTATAVNAL
jgi:hypothetical protein